jgi:hypothetical protein
MHFLSMRIALVFRKTAIVLARAECCATGFRPSPELKGYFSVAKPCFNSPER